MSKLNTGRFALRAMLPVKIYMALSRRAAINKVIDNESLNVYYNNTYFHFSVLQLISWQTS